MRTAPGNPFKMARLQSVSSEEQLFGAQNVLLNSGKSAGTQAIELYNAAGTEMLVLPGRGMDIARLRFQGVNLSPLSSTGIVGAAHYCDDARHGFENGFFMGFLTTGGLQSMGAACESDGAFYGLHGNISNTPARACCEETCWREDGACVRVSGRVVETSAFGARLEMRRTIELDAFRNAFTIRDRFENLGFDPAPLMLLYHLNFGYPFLSPRCRLYVPAAETTPNNEEARRSLDRADVVEAPSDAFCKHSFSRRLRQNGSGMTGYAVVNEERRIGVSVGYSAEALPVLTQWRNFKSGQYVLGLEPGNGPVCGFQKTKEDGRLHVLPPFGVRETQLRVKLFRF